MWARRIAAHRRERASPPDSDVALQSHRGVEFRRLREMVRDVSERLAPITPHRHDACPTKEAMERPLQSSRGPVHARSYTPRQRTAGECSLLIRQGIARNSRAW